MTFPELFLPVAVPLSADFENRRYLVVQLQNELSLAVAAREAAPRFPVDDVKSFRLERRLDDERRGPLHGGGALNREGVLRTLLPLPLGGDLRRDRGLRHEGDPAQQSGGKQVT